MTTDIESYYHSENHFQAIRQQLKQRPCPQCKLTGSLILHGNVYGYEDNNDRIRTVRGRRIFCNNRKTHRNGCGHTFVVRATDKIKHACINAQSLWKFLKYAVKFANKAKALRTLKRGFHPSAAYRLWKQFSLRQSRLRTYLLRICPPPDLPLSLCPPEQTIAHLKAAFGNDPCPVSAFQKRFQTPIL